MPKHPRTSPKLPPKPALPNDPSRMSLIAFNLFRIAVFTTSAYIMLCLADSLVALL